MVANLNGGRLWNGDKFFCFIIYVNPGRVFDDILCEQKSSSAFLDTSFT